VFLAIVTESISDAGFCNSCYCSVVCLSVGHLKLLSKNRFCIILLCIKASVQQIALFLFAVASVSIFCIHSWPCSVVHDFCLFLLFDVQ